MPGLPQAPSGTRKGKTDVDVAAQSKAREPLPAQKPVVALPGPKKVPTLLPGVTIPVPAPQPTNADLLKQLEAVVSRLDKVAARLSSANDAAWNIAVINNIKALGPMATQVTPVPVTPGTPTLFFKNSELAPVSIYLRVENDENGATTWLYAQVGNAGNINKASTIMAAGDNVGELTLVVPRQSEVWVNVTAPAGQATWQVLGHYLTLSGRSSVFQGRS